MDVQAIWWLLLLHCYAGGGLAEDASNHNEGWLQQQPVYANGEKERFLSLANSPTHRTMNENCTDRIENEKSSDIMDDDHSHDSKSSEMGSLHDVKLQIDRNDPFLPIFVPQKKLVKSHPGKEGAVNMALGEVKGILPQEANFKLVTTKLPQVRLPMPSSSEETNGNSSWQSHWKPRVKFSQSATNFTKIQQYIQPSVQLFREHISKRTSVLSRGRRTDAQHSDQDVEQTGFYYSSKEHERLHPRDASRSKSQKRDKNKPLASGQWVEYDFDQTTSTTTEDPNLPKNPVGLKNPNLLVGPWVEEPAVRISKARFDGENNTLVNAQNGTTANLPCIILNRDDHETVSWIRSRDHHLITVGRQTYSSDDRFSVTFNRHLNKWTLHLRYVQPRDAGQYMCQLSTDPVMVYVVRLSVTEASSTIRGGPERYVHEGSSVRLECALQRHTQAPEYVFWYHNRSMINYDVNRKVKVESTPDGSVLTLLSVGRTDSGNYTCSPANAQQASITLHIILGDTLAAMKVSAAPRSLSPTCAHQLLIFLLLPLLSPLLRGVVYAPQNSAPHL